MSATATLCPLPFSPVKKYDSTELASMWVLARLFQVVRCGVVEMYATSGFIANSGMYDGSTSPKCIPVVGDQAPWRLSWAREATDPARPTPGESSLFSSGSFHPVISTSVIDSLSQSLSSTISASGTEWLASMKGSLETDCRASLSPWIRNPEGGIVVLTATWADSSMEVLASQRPVSGEMRTIIRSGLDSIRVFGTSMCGSSPETV